MKLLLLLLLSLCFAQRGDYSSCSEEKTIASGSNHQLKTIYNPKSNEYFSAWIVERTVQGTTQTSLVGMRLSEEGNPKSDKITLVSFEQVAEQKRNPYLVYNPNLNIYIVLFEVYYNGADVDIWAVDVGPTGEVMGYFAIATTAATEDRPTMAYDSLTSGFLFAYEHDFTFQANDPLSGTTTITNHFIKLGKMDGYGRPLPSNYTSDNPTVVSLQIGSHNSRPNLVFNPINSSFLMTFSLDVDGQGHGAIFDALVYRDLTVLGRYNLAQWSLGDNLITAHSPKALWSPNDQQYFLVYELDVDAPIHGRTMIVATTVDRDGAPSPYHIFLNGDEIRNQNPSMAYSPQSDDFLIAFTQDDAKGNYSIRSVAVSSQSLKAHHKIDPLNTADFRENWPVVTYNSKKATFLVMWTSGNPQDAEVLEKRKIEKIEDLPQLHPMKITKNKRNFQLKNVKDPYQLNRATLLKYSNQIEKSNLFKRQMNDVENVLKAMHVCSSDMIEEVTVETGFFRNTTKTDVAVVVFLILFILGFVILLAYILYDKKIRYWKGRNPVQLKDNVELEAKE